MTMQIVLLDFGATRTFSTEFAASYLQLLTAAVNMDRQASLEWSRNLGFLTGEETEVRFSP